MKHFLKIAPAFLLVAGLLLSTPAFAQTSPSKDPFPYSNRFSLVSGLTQVFLGGFNLEATWYTPRMSFDYSHGIGLKFTGPTIGEEPFAQRLEAKMPWTTGLGVGYRLTPFLDIRVEPKLHRYELFYDDQSLSGDPIQRYTTATLGLGVYYRYYPFRKKDNALNGILIVPNARFWPNVWSSLDNDEWVYENVLTEKTETHRASTQGIPGTGGFFVNVSVGYTF